MKYDQVVLDPTAEIAAIQRPRIPRPLSLDGKTIGLLDIAKPRSDEFLDRLEERLRERGLDVKRYRKVRFSNLATTALMREIAADCGIVIEALAD